MEFNYTTNLLYTVSTTFKQLIALRYISLELLRKKQTSHSALQICTLNLPEQYKHFPVISVQDCFSSTAHSSILDHPSRKERQ